MIKYATSKLGPYVYLLSYIEVEKNRIEIVFLERNTELAIEMNGKVDQFNFKLYVNGTVLAVSFAKPNTFKLDTYRKLTVINPKTIKEYENF